MRRSHSLWTQGFRFSFTPLPGFFSPFLHSTLLYRSLRVFSLAGWSPLLPPGFLVSRRTLAPALPPALSPTGLSPSLAGFPKAVPLRHAVSFCGPLPRGARAAVWALPVPLAATPGIDLSFFSSGYLDVSVRRVPLHALCVHAWIHRVRPVWVSPFRHLRITGHVPLPAAFRSLSRLSSALSAKASALRLSLLDLPWLHSVAAAFSFSRKKQSCLFIYCLFLLVCFSVVLVSASFMLPPFCPV